jgi:hypothetical protein
MTITKRDIIRAIHSDVVDWITNAKLNGGWYSLTNDTFTYASASTFTVDGDWTDIFQCGIKLRCLNTTQKYFYVVSAAYSAPNTTVTVTGGSDYTLASAAISDLAITGCETPRKFPDFFNFTPVWGGGSSPTIGAGTLTSRFKIAGRLLTWNFKMIWAADTSVGAGNWTFTLPVTVANTITAYGSGNIRDAATADYPVIPTVAQAATTISLFIHAWETTNTRTLTATSPITFTTSARVDFTIIYEI